MAGHSKWKNIRRKKEIEDFKKSQSFTKIARLIFVAVKKGGGDAITNPDLRLMIEKAKEARMPKENIERAIKKGSGGVSGDGYEEVYYEGFGPDGGAFLMRCVTDNKNRTVAELRTILNKNGGSLGTIGSTAYVFGPDYKNPLFRVKINQQKEVLLDNIIKFFNESDDVIEFFDNYELKIGSNLC